MNHGAPQPLIVNFTPTGMVPTKAATPHVPIGPAEIFERPIMKPTAFRAFGFSNPQPSGGVT
jgi:hypothetical protein